MQRNIEISPGQGALLDQLIAENELKNDAQLARGLSVAPPVISKVRHGKLPVGATLMLAIHETYGKSIADMRKVLAG